MEKTTEAAAQLQGVSAAQEAADLAKKREEQVMAQPGLIAGCLCLYCWVCWASLVLEWRACTSYQSPVAMVRMVRSAGVQIGTYLICLWVHNALTL